MTLVSIPSDKQNLPSFTLFLPSFDMSWVEVIVQLSLPLFWETVSDTLSACSLTICYLHSLKIERWELLCSGLKLGCVFSLSLCRSIPMNQNIYSECEKPLFLLQEDVERCWQTFMNQAISLPGKRPFQNNPSHLFKDCVDSMVPYGCEC